MRKMRRIFVSAIICGFLTFYVSCQKAVSPTPDPRCPTVKKDQPGICGYMCYDGPEPFMRKALPCKEGEICCPTSCDGRSCLSIKDIQEMNNCNPNPCMNGGECRDNGSDFQCVCTQGADGTVYTGKYCENATKPDPCAKNPCLNGGVCTSSADRSSYSCYCQIGFVGDNCQTDTDPCRGQPCLNNGACVPFSDGQNFNYFCQCAAGYTGINCETSQALCPGNQRWFDCRINPCEYQYCHGIPNVICKPDYCGGCNARFYTGNVDVTSICSFGFSFW